MIDPVEKEELEHVAKAVEVMRYTMQEMLEDYFDKFDSKKPEDCQGILWDFERNRAKAAIIADYLQEASAELKRSGITFWR